MDFKLPVVAALIIGGTACLQACSSTNPFSNSLPDTDRVFLMAAGNWDQNRDNSITCDEWKKYVSELFDGADDNRDGALDSAEWAKVVAVDRMFSTANLNFFDMNNDGKVTRDEFQNRPNPAFTLLDKEKTCVLSGSQVAGARSQTQFDTAGKPKESGDPREKGGPGSNPGLPR